MGTQVIEEENKHLLNPCEENETPGEKKKSYIPEELKPHWKILLLAIILLVAGFAFIGIAIYIVTLPSGEDGPHSYVFFLCGFICIIPGGYHVIYIYNALRGKDGYSFESLPKYEY